jgi:hypothetical protein
MPTATLTCPHCSQSLRATKAFHAGSRFRCPGCGAVFTAPGDDALRVSSRGGSAGRGGSAEDEAPRGAGAWLMLVGVVGVSLLLLAGAGVALALHFLPKKESPPVAAAPPKPSAPATAPTPSNLDPPTNHQRPQPQPVDLPPPNLAPEPPAQAWLPPDQQDKVNAAIDHGVAFLEKEQSPGGTWSLNDQTGLAALPGLTLLECGVPADDPHVQKAAQFVRGSAAHLQSQHTTYELALSILFLDRLGERADEPLIRSMALRLMAGQQPSGGWNYNCPVLSDQDEQRLSGVLEATRPRTSLDLMAAKTGGDRGLDDLFTGRTVERPAPPQGGTIPLSPGPTEEEKKQAKLMYDGLSPQLKNMPALKPPTDDGRMPGGDGTDNSNTQFATLGLWAAGRHGVPMERALALLGKRFQVSQTRAGGWMYNYSPHPAGGETPAMTAAGLLGLAVGHGVKADLKGPDVQAAGEDPQVEQGMKALSQFIKDRPAGLYFLWSVERVGMLYGRRTIADKEWYPGGVAFLLNDQKNDGSWRSGGYPGASPTTDSCFALLFLKRANLAKDLTGKLQFLTQVKNP